MNNEKKVVAYQVREVPLSLTWDGDIAGASQDTLDLNKMLANGWQPWGSPFLKTDDSPNSEHKFHYVLQAFVQYKD